MTNKLQQITTLALATILIAGSFSLTPFAYSTGWNDDDDDSNKISKGLCKNSSNLIKNGCFEIPVVTNSKKWDLYEKQNPDTINFGWDVLWLKDHDEGDGLLPFNPCVSGEPGFDSQGLLELQKGILGGPSEGYQHAELDSDCNGPITNARSGEKSSVGISQILTTSENNDYKITFAYKARPDLPLQTNGLIVTWNDGTIANNLEFSKKSWKYTSITVPGINGQTKLSFEDTGESDSLGTFLDDVSVIPIPKPMSVITLKKAITNDNSGTSGPSDFVLKIKNVDTHAETVITQGVETSVPAGTYTMSESGPSGYSFVLIAGDDSCPTMLENAVDDSDLFTLKKGEHITCVIYNDDNNDGQSPTNDPPTITIVNNVESEPAFSITVSPNTGITGSDPTTTYTVDSHTQVTISGSDDRPILITGDGNCPENIGGFVNIENGQDITCIYSDRPTNEVGIVFRPTHVTFVPGESPTFTLPEGGEVTIVSSTNEVTVIDPAFDGPDADSLIIVYTLIDTSHLGQPIVCFSEGIVGTDSGNGFRLTCPDSLQESLYALNYALINTIDIT